METAPAPSPRCAVLARALHEPLAGTAPVARRWLCVEYRGAWPRDLASHADPVLRALTERAAATGWRLLLIRRPGRRVAGSAGVGLGVADRIRAASGPVTVFLADTDLTSPRVTMLTLPPADLAR